MTSRPSGLDVEDPHVEEEQGERERAPWAIPSPLAANAAAASAASPANAKGAGAATAAPWVNFPNGVPVRQRASSASSPWTTTVPVPITGHPHIGSPTSPSTGGVGGGVGMGVLGGAGGGPHHPHGAGRLPPLRPAQPVSEGSRYMVPRKLIRTEADLARFRTTRAFQSVTQTISAMNGSLRGRLLSEPCTPSGPCAAILAILQHLVELVDTIPPVEQPMRYGNKAFKTWHDRMLRESAAALQRLTGDPEAHMELLVYFGESFGNSTRIDYGTGHELTFVAWLAALVKLGVLSLERDAFVLASRVFQQYLVLMRKIQTTYWLEPAGSRGVWGLDDYQFLPFIFGSSQLIGRTELQPADVAKPLVIQQHADDFMYLQAVKFLLSVKSGRFEEHSPILNDITAVPKWEKVNSGLFKMYNHDVLSKFPVIQHFLFGSVLSFDKAAPAAQQPARGAASASAPAVTAAPSSAAAAAASTTAATAAPTTSASASK